MELQARSGGAVNVQELVDNFNGYKDRLKHHFCFFSIERS